MNKYSNQPKEAVCLGQTLKLGTMYEPNGPFQDIVATGLSRLPMRLSA